MTQKQSAYGEHAIPISMAMKKIEELRGTLSTRDATIASQSAALALAREALTGARPHVEFVNTVAGDGVFNIRLTQIDEALAAIDAVKGAGEKG